MNDLSSFLSSLGVRTEVATTVPAGVGDQIDELLEGAIPWRLGAAEWHPTLIWHARDLHQTLSSWLQRLEHNLARHGIKVTHTLEGPKVSHPRYGYEAECEHPTVDVSETLQMIFCRTCKMPVNPGWWLARHTNEIERAEQHRVHLHQERAELHAEIEGLKSERSKVKQQVRRGKMSVAKQAIETDMPELTPKRRKKR